MPAKKTGGFERFQSPEAKEASKVRRGGERSGYLNIRFSDTARWILDELQEHLGLSQASIVEMLLREEARRRNFIIPGSGADRARREAEAERLRRLGDQNPVENDNHHHG